ncbi:hypothetical protein PybrP1_004949 [[Pythium] brassicae (nom. inval.)]|nr:hypothetical protein PybrP1_004949 [[Pythium] brassicae (nom. inval.)]
MSSSSTYLADHRQLNHHFQLPTPMASAQQERYSASTAGGSGTCSGGKPAGATAAVDVTGTNNGYGFRSTAGDALSIEVAHMNPRRRFPLADEFLPRVSVSPAQTRELKRVCEQMVADALINTSLFSWGGSANGIVGAAAKDWKLHYSKPNLACYRRRKEQTGDAATRHFVARGQVHSMNLQDVEYGMYCDTTMDERAFVSPRDYAFVEYSKRVVNKLGEPFLVKVTHSLSTDHVPLMSQREFDLVRGVVSCTYVYRYDAPSKNVQVFADGYLDPSGSAPGWLSKSFLTKFAPTIVNLERSADVKYIMRNQLVLPHDAFVARVAAQPKDSKRRCSMCLKAFGRLVARGHTRCRACAEPVCSHCVLALSLCVPWHEKRCADHPSAVVSEKFCFKCLYTGRLDRNGQYLLAPLESHSQRADGATSEAGESEELPASMFPQATGGAREDEGWSTDNDGGDVVSEQDRLRRLRLRHLEREKRKNMDSRREPKQRLYHGPQPAYNPAAFRDMERSLAEQEALIRSIQSERAKLAHHRAAAPGDAYAHYNSRLARNSSSEWDPQDSESRFETLDSSDDDDADPEAPRKTRFFSATTKPSISQSTRTTVSSASDSLGSSWDFRSH